MIDLPMFSFDEESAEWVAENNGILEDGNVVEEWRHPNRLDRNNGRDSHLIRSVIEMPEEEKRPDLPRRPPESPFRLLGQWHDPETGLCATRFRQFDPEVASWLSPDPLLLDGGENAFAFDGAPTIVTDPLGLHPGQEGDKNGGGDEGKKKKASTCSGT